MDSSDSPIPPHTGSGCEQAICRLRVFRKLFLFGSMAVIIPYLLYILQDQDQYSSSPKHDTRNIGWEKIANLPGVQIRRNMGITRDSALLEELGEFEEPGQYEELAEVEKSGEIEKPAEISERGDQRDKEETEELKKPDKLEIQREIEELKNTGKRDEVKDLRELEELGQPGELRKAMELEGLKKPKEVGEPGELEDPGELKEPVKPEEPGELEDPGELREPVKPEEPGELEDPGELQEPVKPEEPGELEDPGELREPAKAEEPGEPVEILAVTAGASAETSNETSRETSSPVPRDLLLGDKGLRGSNQLDVQQDVPSKAEELVRPASEQLPLRYQLQIKNRLMVGKQMNVSRDLLRSIGLPQTHFMDLNRSNVGKIMFVTAASENHFEESIAAIARVQHFFPGKLILYYDIGLADDQRQKISTWCNVKYHKFDYSKYPDHVQDLRQYSWKPLIVQEIFSSYPDTGLVWMDASFRIQTSNLSVVFEKVISNRGLFTFNHCSHSVYAVTHPQMYEYLPSNTELLKPLNMQGANSMFIYPTREIYQGFLYWWYLCALDEQCQAPPNITRPCPLVFEKVPDRQNVYIEFCHRYDQSSMNVLIGNMYGYDVYKYTVRYSAAIVKVIRKRLSEYSIQLCHQ